MFDRCGAAERSLSHLFWHCPVLCNFWCDIFKCFFFYKQSIINIQPGCNLPIFGIWALPSHLSKADSQCRHGCSKEMNIISLHRTHVSGGGSTKCLLRRSRFVLANEIHKTMFCRRGSHFWHWLMRPNCLTGELYRLIFWLSTTHVCFLFICFARVFFPSTFLVERASHLFYWYCCWLTALDMTPLSSFVMSAIMLLSVLFVLCVKKKKKKVSSICVFFLRYKEQEAEKLMNTNMTKKKLIGVWTSFQIKTLISFALPLALWAHRGLSLNTY